MGTKVIKMRLSTASIEAAIQELRAYKSELRLKCSIFVQRLAEVGIETIEAHKYSRGDSDFNDLRTHVWLDESDTHVKATLVLSGKDVAFIEFGSGIHYNGAGGSSPSPFGQSLGMVIGSYGKGKGLENSWTYYDTEQGRFRISYGTEAAMPMYRADQQIREQFISIAKEVFE